MHGALPLSSPSLINPQRLTFLICLATAPAREGGRLRLSWKPWAHSFQLVHTKDGATVAATVSYDVEPLHAEFVKKAAR